MLTNKDILLDLFYQVTDYQAKDVDWVDCQESLPFYDLDFAMLRVMMKSGEYVTVMNQFGNVHVQVTDRSSTDQADSNTDPS